MPVKRRLAKGRAHRITDEAVEAFRAGDRDALYAALRLKPWEVNPLDVDGGPSPWPGGAGAASWPEMQELRRELLERG